MSFGLSAAAVGLIAAGTGAAVGIYGANKAANTQSESAANATQAGTAATNASIAENRRQYDQNRADQAGYMSRGNAAGNQLSALMQPGGALTQPFTGANLQNDPGYQFSLTQGQRGLDNSAAAHGGYYSGAQLKAASRYNTDYAGTKFNDAWTRNNTDQTNTYNRLAGIAGTGQQATNNVGANGLSTASTNGSLMTNNAFNNGQNTMGAGNARASSYLAGGNALQSALNQGVSAWNGYNNGGYNNNYSDEMARLRGQM